jgi:hypothetical protein
MELNEVMERIEQTRFSTELNIASGVSVFLRILRGHELFVQLVDLARESPFVRDSLFTRIEEIAQAKIDLNYENPFDVALSAYLIVLERTADRNVAGQAAKVANEAPKLGWARGIAREIMERLLPKQKAEAGSSISGLARALMTMGEALKSEAGHIPLIRRSGYRHPSVRRKPMGTHFSVVKKRALHGTEHRTR